MQPGTVGCAPICLADESPRHTSRISQHSQRPNCSMQSLYIVTHLVALKVVVDAGGLDLGPALLLPLQELGVGLGLLLLCPRLESARVLGWRWGWIRAVTSC